MYPAKVDLDNFFYRLEVAPQWWPYFALPPVRAADVGVADRFGDVMVHPVCKRLPMGWAHSPYLAQAAHEHVIDTETGLRPADRICADNDTVVDRDRHQQYIDDLILYGYDPVALARRYLPQPEHHLALAAMQLNELKNHINVLTTEGMAEMLAEVFNYTTEVALVLDLLNGCGDTAAAAIARQQAVSLVQAPEARACVQAELDAPGTTLDAMVELQNSVTA